MLRDGFVAMNPDYRESNVSGLKEQRVKKICQHANVITVCVSYSTYAKLVYYRRWLSKWSAIAIVPHRIIRRSKGSYTNCEISFKTVDPVNFIQDYLGSYKQVTGSSLPLQETWKITYYGKSEVLVQDWFLELILGNSAYYARTLLQFPELVSIVLVVTTQGIYLDACIVRIDL